MKENFGNMWEYLEKLCRRFIWEVQKDDSLFDRLTGALQIQNKQWTEYFAMLVNFIMAYQCCERQNWPLGA